MENLRTKVNKNLFIAQVGAGLGTTTGILTAAQSDPKYLSMSAYLGGFPLGYAIGAIDESFIKNGTVRKIVKTASKVLAFASYAVASYYLHRNQKATDPYLAMTFGGVGNFFGGVGLGMRQKEKVMIENNLEDELNKTQTLELEPILKK